MNEPAHQALFFCKVLRVLRFLWLVVLVLNQAVDDAENGVHLKQQQAAVNITGTGEATAWGLCNEGTQNEVSSGRWPF